MDKCRKIVYIAEFIAIIAVFGLMSVIQLADFYINPKKVNNLFSTDPENPLEEDLAYSFWGKEQFVNLNGAVRRILDQRLMNNVIKLDNGYLFTSFERASDQSLKMYAENTVRLKDYLKERGTELLYVTTPITSSKYDPQLPEGIEDHGNGNTDRFLALLDEGGVDYIDIRERMHADGIDQYDMMYRTDHHWTTEAGLYAYGLLEDYIVEKTGCAVDPRVADISNYTVTKYEKWHLGSRGQRTGIYYAGIDDYDLILPDFETLLSDGKGHEAGMQELMVDMKPLQDKDYSSRYTYDDVLKKALGEFTNHKCENDIRILIITDSMGKVVVPYLALGFKQLCYSANSDTSGITPEYIEACDPDVVIMLYYPESLLDGKQAFSFQGF